MTDKLLIEIKGHTALITINNPAANTWDAENLTALRDLIGELNVNDDIYSLVITGAGEKFFSAGADLKMFASGDPEVARDLANKFGVHLRRQRKSRLRRSPPRNRTDVA